MTNLPFTLDDILLTNTTWLTVTNRCNINCRYCFNYINKNNIDMAPELAVNIIKSHYEHLKAHSKDEPHLRIIFFGGEPTTNPEAIFAVLDYLGCEKIPATPRLLTNGIIGEALLEKLMNTNLQFQVSFDGITNNVRLSKSGADNVNHLTLKTIATLSDRKIPLRIRATIHEDNVAHMSELIELVSPYHFDSIAFLPIFKDGNALKNNLNPPSRELYLHHLKEAHNTATNLNVRLTHSQLSLPKRIEDGPERPSLVWLPDGNLMLTIKYASTEAASRANAIVGKFDALTQSIVLDKDNINRLNHNFVKSRQHYCEGCTIYAKCQGLNCLDDLSLNLERDSQQRYFCELAREIIQGDYI